MIFLIVMAIGMLVLGLNAGLNLMQLIWLQYLKSLNDSKSAFLYFLDKLSNHKWLRFLSTAGFLLPYGGGFVIYGQSQMITYLIFAAATLFFFTSVYLQGKRIIPLYRKLQAHAESIDETEVKKQMNALQNITYVRFTGAVLAFGILSYLFFYFLETGMPL